MHCVAVRNGTAAGQGHYGSLISDMYVTEAGLRAEEEGYDAVVIDTVSDAGLYPLRARLTIPVIGPGLVSYAVAIMLGKRFSIITMWERWRHLYERNLGTYHLWQKCASIRAVGVPPDVEALFAGKEDELLPKIADVARKALEDDGADVILLGSTTMHQAGEYLARHLEAPVVNPGPVAIKITEALLQLGLSHSEAAFPTPDVLQDEKFFSLIGVGDAVSGP